LFPCQTTVIATITKKRTIQYGSDLRS